jgi:hypothetical protein
MVKIMKRSKQGKDRKRFIEEVWLTPEEREAAVYFDNLLDEGDNIPVAVEETRKQFPMLCDQFYGWLGQ